MWMSKRGGIAGEHRGAAGTGQVTIGGMQPAVCTEGEVRRAAVLGPAGYYWSPAAGDRAMVLQAGDLGEEACLAGIVQEPPVKLEPGQAMIGTAGSYILIDENGVSLHGAIQVDGTLTVGGKMVVSGQMRASDEVHLNGAVFINGIFQVDD